ncbi:hypothetical protein B0H14DRAFT_3891244 [Mycena olivaceomarginata]|nr:hypothetical protein B0H14DRAFT_3891244 [Mycena olivaceomarginata]
MEFQDDLDELFYATFPNARPSLHSALVEVEHARIFMPPELREHSFGAEMGISVADTHRRPAFEYGSESYQNPVFASAYLEQQRFEPMNIAGHAAPLEMPISNTTPGSVDASPQSFECGIGSYSSVLSVLSYGSPPRLSSEDTHPNITLPGSSMSSPVPSTSATMKPRDKKLPACLFCRKRKIACAPALGVCRGAMKVQAQCNQCYRRRLDCVYPTERQRGTKKKQPSALTRTGRGESGIDQWRRHGYHEGAAQYILCHACWVHCADDFRE